MRASWIKKLTYTISTCKCRKQNKVTKKTPIISKLFKHILMAIYKLRKYNKLKTINVNDLDLHRENSYQANSYDLIDHFYGLLHECLLLC